MQPVAGAKPGQGGTPGEVSPSPPLAALPLPPASSSVEDSNTSALVALELMSASLQEMSRLEHWNRKARVPAGVGGAGGL
jgi:hypothetical protein